MIIKITLYRQEMEKHSHRYKIDIQNYEESDKEELDLLQEIDITVANWLTDVELEENRRQELPFN